MKITTENASWWLNLILLLGTKIYGVIKSGEPADATEEIEMLNANRMKGSDKTLEGK